MPATLRTPGFFLVYSLFSGSRFACLCFWGKISSCTPGWSGTHDNLSASIPEGCGYKHEPLCLAPVYLFIPATTMAFSASSVRPSPLRSPICCPLVQRARQSLWAILKGDKVTCSLIPLTAKTKELDRYVLLQEPSPVIPLNGFPDKVSCKWAWPQTPSSAPQMCPSVLIPSEMQACLTLDLQFHLWKLIPQTACPGAKKSICSSAPVNHLFCLLSHFCLPFYYLLLLGAW